MKPVRLIALLSGVVLAPVALAQSAWPNKPVRVVVAFAPGGIADVAARLISIPLGVGSETARLMLKPGFSRCNPVSSVSVGTCAPRGNLECVDQR